MHLLRSFSSNLRVALPKCLVLSWPYWTDTWFYATWYYEVNIMPSSGCRCVVMCNGLFTIYFMLFINDLFVLIADWLTYRLVTFTFLYKSAYLCKLVWLYAWYPVLGPKFWSMVVINVLHSVNVVSLRWNGNDLMCWLVIAHFIFPIKRSQKCWCFRRFYVSWLDWLCSYSKLWCFQFLLDCTAFSLLLHLTCIVIQFCKFYA